MGWAIDFPKDCSRSSKTILCARAPCLVQTRSGSVEHWEACFKRRDVSRPKCTKDQGLTRSRILEEFFQRYLSSLVDLAIEPLRITYNPALSNTGPKEFTSPSARSPSEVSPKQIEIRVLTPAFYSRFIHYAHTSEAFDRESLCTDPRNRTLWLTNPENLPMLLPKRSECKVARPDGGFASLRWSALRRLRYAPSAPAYPIIPSQAAVSLLEDIRKLPFSEMDLFVQHSCENADVYRRTAVVVFLARRLAFDFTELLQTVDILFRTVLIIVCMPAMSTKEDGRLAGSGNQQWLTLMGATLRVGAVHAWACLKAAV